MKMIRDLKEHEIECKVSILKENLYYYRYNDDSLTTRYRPDRFEASLRFYEKLCESTAILKNSDINERCIRAFTNNVIVCIKQEELYSRKRFCDALRMIRGICDNETVQRLLDIYPIYKMPTQARLLFLCIKHKYPLTIMLITKAKRLKK